MSIQNSDNTIVCSSLNTIHDLFNAKLLVGRYLHCTFRTSSLDRKYVRSTVRAGKGLGASFTGSFDKYVNLDVHQ